jgi:hypothetical protein
MDGIRVVDAASGDKVQDLEASISSRACWMPDGEHVIVVTYSGVQMRRVGGDVVRTWNRPGTRVEDMSISADGRLLVLANRSEVELRDLDNESISLSFGTSYRSETVDVSPDGRFLVGSGPWGLGLWSLEATHDAADASPLGALLGEAYGDRAVWAPDGVRVLAKAKDGLDRWAKGAWIVNATGPAESRDARARARPELVTEEFASHAHVRDVAWLSNDIAALATEDAIEMWQCSAGQTPAEIDGRLPLKANWIAANPAAGRFVACTHEGMVAWRFSPDESATPTVGGSWFGARLVQGIRDRVHAAKRQRAKERRDHLTSRYGQAPPDDLFDAQIAFNEARETSSFQWKNVEGAIVNGSLARVELRPGLCVYRERESRTTQRTEKKLMVAPRGPCWVLVLHTAVSGGMQRSADGAVLTFELTNRRSSEDRVPAGDESSDVFVVVADGQSRECWHIDFHAAKDGFESS